MDTVTTIKIMVPISLTLSEGDFCTDEESMLIPSENIDLPYKYKELYEFSEEMTYQDDQIFDNLKFHSLAEFTKNFVNQTESIPEDIASIIDKEFWNMI